MLETKDLTFRYPGGKQFSFPSFTLNKGDQVIIRGKSGSGKTTLLHLTAGILKPSGGRVVINGTGIHDLTPAETDRFRGKNIGLIFQQHYFIHSLTMEDNLLLAQALPGNPTDRKAISGLLAELDISMLAQKKPSALSQGELQRFSVARAMINQPVVILADEPTSSLDDENCSRFIRLLLDISGRHGTTLLIATHDNRLSKEFSTVIDL
jgi:putative ABC transport system ATP-binding protein